jgi:large subunit ribosomal protein L3
MRTGLIAEKIGMTQVFEPNGTQVPVTVLKVSPCTVIERKSQDVHGYNAVQLGTREVSPTKLAKPQREYFAKKNLAPKKILKEFRVSADALLDVGVELTAEHFAAGQYIDVTGTSVGKGFAGGMKRHNFGGLRASHGVSVSHRSHGSTGNRQDPGKVFKNKKMAGHMGHVRVTKLNLTVHSIDAERGLILVKGSVPGPKSGIVYVRDAVKMASRA